MSSPVVLVSAVLSCLPVSAVFVTPRTLYRSAVVALGYCTVSIATGLLRGSCIPGAILWPCKLLPHQQVGVMTHITLIVV
jgi:hypothetical protein